MTFAAISPSFSRVSRPRTTTGTGTEVLVLERDSSVVTGLERLLGDAGMVVSAFADPTRAAQQIEMRFISVALIDVDTPAPGAGLDFLRLLKEQSPLTSPIMMTARTDFDVVAPLFRAGAIDVVPKAREQVNYLRDRVLAASRDIRQTSQRDRLIEDVAAVHDDFLRKMMEMSKQILDLEDRVLGRDPDVSSSVNAIATVDVLLVDDEPALHAVLEAALPAEQGWRLRYAQSGGEGLDAATSRAPTMFVVKEQLPDLPGHMLVRTVKAQSPDTVALLFTPPGEDGAGEIKMADASRLHTLVAQFTDPEQLLNQIRDVREAVRKQAKERRYLQAFRKQHFDFLNRYNVIRQRLGTPK